MLAVGGGQPGCDTTQATGESRRFGSDALPKRPSVRTTAPYSRAGSRSGATEKPENWSFAKHRDFIEARELIEQWAPRRTREAPAPPYGGRTYVERQGQDEARADGADRRRANSQRRGLTDRPRCQLTSSMRGRRPNASAGDVADGDSPEHDNASITARLAVQKNPRPTALQPLSTMRSLKQRMPHRAHHPRIFEVRLRTQSVMPIGAPYCFPRAIRKSCPCSCVSRPTSCRGSELALCAAGGRQ